MRATFSGIEIGRTGLTVSQLGLDVTGHNIANVETEGYTRQRIVQTAYDPFASIGRALPVSEALVGGGVRIKILDQIRSAYLDRRYRTENTINAYWQKRTEGLTYLESYFDNVNEETSINYSIGKFFEAIKVLAEDPVEGAPRKLLQTAGMDLVQQLNTIYDGLIDLQSTQNLAVKITVEDINRMANEIVELNKSIYGFEVTGNIANDLRDKRNLLLDQLSALIDIEYREEPDSKGGQRLVVEIGGRALVDHDKQYLLDVELRDNVIEGEEQVWIPIWAPTNVPGPDPLTGEYVANIRGLDGTKVLFTQLYDPTAIIPAIDMSDLAAVQKAVGRINEIIAQFARITPEWADVDTTAGLGSPVMPPDAQALFDELNIIVGGTATVFDFQGDVKTVSGWEWCVHTGINIGGKDVVYACSDPPQAQRKVGLAGVEYGLSDVPTEDLVVKGGELKAYLDMRDNYAIGTVSTPTPGIPYYIDMLNNLARAFVQEINEVHREGWTDPPGGGSVNGVNFFNEEFWENSAGDLLIRNNLGQWVDPATNTVVSNPATTPGYTAVTFDLSLITAKNIRLSDEVMTSVYNIACSTKEIVKNGDPDELQRGNNENMNALYELFLKKNISIDVMIGGVPTTVDIGAFDSYATAIRFDVANTLSFAKKTTVNSDVLLTAAQNQRVSISGVSLDEEMINMVKYQHAYSGASRVITAMDDMLDRLINNTGRVGL